LPLAWKRGHGICIELADPTSQYRFLYLKVPCRLGNTDATVLNQLHRLKLELFAE
jgi:hypothetical protein